MTELIRPRVKYVIGPDGSPLTIADLPPANTRRWVIRRKAEVVAAVRGGLLSLEEACERYTLTVEEFLRWSMDQERGRYELEAGRIVAMQAENASHTKTKQRVYSALQAAIARSEATVYAMPDGPTVRIAADRAYEPDALIATLPEVADDALEIPNPIAVFEVLSPSPASMRRDLTVKVEGYSRVATIEHYVIIDPTARLVLHYRRRGDVLVPPAAPKDGILRLDPPWIGGVGRGRVVAAQNDVT